MKVRLLLADDHPLVRSGLIKLLESYKDFVVIGEAKDGEEAVAMTRKLKPDIAIIDISMPKLSGIEATKIICREIPETKVLVLTMHENEEYIYQILKSGAGGYILKNATKDELASAIHEVASGKKFFSPKVSEIIVNRYLHKAKERDAASSEDEGGLPLTRREKEILYQIALGKNNAQIGEIMFISPRTVETHRTNIMQKLDIHDASNLVRFALMNKDKLGVAE